MKAMLKKYIHQPRPIVASLLAVLLLPVLTALACRAYFHQQAAADKVEFYLQSLDVMYQRQAQNLPKGSILFFGDSHIQGLSVTAISPKAVNFGVGHLQLQRLAQNIERYPNLKHAEKIVIGIGINDLLQHEFLQQDAAIADLLTALQCCSTKVVLLSVLPVDEVTLNQPGMNKKIIALNQKLKSAALQTGATYLELYPEFLDDQGQLALSYNLGDGLHLNPIGNQLFIELLRNKVSLGSSNVQ